MKLHMIFAPRSEHRHDLPTTEHEDLPLRPSNKRSFDTCDSTYFNEETGLHHVVMTTGEVDAVLDIYSQLVADAELLPLPQRIQVEIAALKWKQCLDQRN